MAAVESVVVGVATVLALYGYDGSGSYQLSVDISNNLFVQQLNMTLQNHKQIQN